MQALVVRLVVLSVFASLGVGIALAAEKDGVEVIRSKIDSLAQDEPITLPKLDVARVTARVNVRPSEETAAQRDERVRTQRLGAVTTIRVQSEWGASYTLSNGLPGNPLRSRELDQFRVPMWQIGKF